MFLLIIISVIWLSYVFVLFSFELKTQRKKPNKLLLPNQKYKSFICFFIFFYWKNCNLRVEIEYLIKNEHISHNIQYFQVLGFH
jgi:hypothetical protein